ncbi:hypothetical protein CMUS01_11628 [Colletotrichum musicola]|uniref:Uncharacterized protein n=1 Tax=Colletotrichum musicola TaxID=2175873 RepID=A0A8H6N4J7_9PEZI|nr:hypothetical protein CMUS01_11628 [Colletotrichum musicola]
MSDQPWERSASVLVHPDESTEMKPTPPSPIGVMSSKHFIHGQLWPVSTSRSLSDALYNPISPCHELSSSHQANEAGYSLLPAHNDHHRHPRIWHGSRSPLIALIELTSGISD